ncbi:MAG TPA: cache domain-containing protein, partial [Methylobacter sp.]
MKNYKFFAKSVVMVLSILFASVALADEKRGTAEEAVALVKKAAAYLKANGKEKAALAFADQKGEFFKGDLYIFASDSSGTAWAHGANPRLVGKNMSELKDADGKFFVKDFL